MHCVAQVREMLWPLPLAIREMASVSWAKRVTSESLHRRRRRAASVVEAGGAGKCMCGSPRLTQSVDASFYVHASSARKVVDVCGLCGMQVASRQPLGPRL